jgi:hypothetical protein
MYYLMRYPSSWGMGSDVDIYLITEYNLKRLIVEELKRKDKNSTVMTGRGLHIR